MEFSSKILTNQILFMLAQSDYFPEKKMLFDQYLAFKIMSGVILFTGAIIFSLIPLALAALRNKFVKEEFIVQILDIINGFGGGALLSSGFLHLLRKLHFFNF
jgi:hypothetical protein